MWWRTLVIPVLGRLRQEDRRFKARLSNLERPSTVSKIKNGQAWWRMLVIPVLGRLRQEDCRFTASLSYLERPSATQ